MSVVSFLNPTLVYLGKYVIYLRVSTGCLDSLPQQRSGWRLLGFTEHWNVIMLDDVFILFNCYGFEFLRQSFFFFFFFCSDLCPNMGFIISSRPFDRLCVTDPVLSAMGCRGASFDGLWVYHIMSGGCIMSSLYIFRYLYLLQV